MNQLFTKFSLALYFTVLIISHDLLAQKPKFGIGGIPLIPTDSSLPVRRAIKDYFVAYGPYGFNLPKKKIIRASAPVLGIGIDGATITTHNTASNPTGIVPMDNTVAISNLTGSLSKRQLIGCNNVGFEIYEEDGNPIADGLLKDWLNLFFAPSLPGKFYDPKLIYDPEENKFIFVCVYKEDPGDLNSKLIVLCSIDEDPNNAWIARAFDNPDAGAEFYDQPNIALSGKDLYISVGDVLINNNTNYISSDIYQIPKASLYALGALPYNIFEDVLDKDLLATSILPITDGIPLLNGQINNYGPGLYLASNFTSLTQSKVCFYDIIDDFSTGPLPTLLKYELILPNGFDVPWNAQQPATARVLNPGNSRYQSGFYADGNIHLVNTTALGEMVPNSGGSIANPSTVNYLRVPVANLQGFSIARVVPSYEAGKTNSYAFPSLCHIGTTKENKSIAITYFASGQQIYPEIRCVTIDDAMQISQETTFRKGDGNLAGSLPNVTLPKGDRWGDYSGIQRVYDQDECPTFWTAGTFGNIDNKYQSFYGSNICFPNQISPIYLAENYIKVYPNPSHGVFNVNANSLANQTLHIYITDLLGKQLRTTEVSLTIGKNIIPINALGLTSGTYFLNIVNNKNEKQHAKITIQ